MFKIIKATFQFIGRLLWYLLVVSITPIYAIILIIQCDDAEEFKEEYIKFFLHGYEEWANNYPY